MSTTTTLKTANEDMPGLLRRKFSALWTKFIIQKLHLTWFT